ncbi:DNA polymerase IV [Aequorivita sp. H23M31]|uniref:DNA polymerase IV n=1 Tax=Aequorivita ciconiae TaxID=2494375 RepID=A0A410G555_9FLAO|nr:DNA polymerase IV [Aequorivita sp. H23M31]QAA82418.1 DNA polymerase IV [Aequorivita sp. H23M31]
MLEDQYIRKIIHVDMDAFYASVEQLDNPELVGKPLAVGGSEKRGVVAAASYEARKYGVRSAMSGMAAKRNCPELIFVPPRFDRYRQVSQEIREIFLEYTDMVEPLSLDEAYLDVTENKKGNPSATKIAEEIRQRIKERTGLNASAGISVNKFVAKIASDINKPNGQKTISPEEVVPFLETLDVKKFFGVGKVTRQKMYRLGIYTGKDLKERPLEMLVKHFGKSGNHYYNVVRGIHKSEVKSFRKQKSLAAEHTFSENISSEIFMMERLEEIAKEVEGRLIRRKLAGKTVTLKIRYSDFTIQTRSKTVSEFIDSKQMILYVVKELLYQEKMKDSVRLLGISISNLNNENLQKEDVPKEIIEVQLKLEF